MQQWARQPIIWSIVMIVLGLTLLSPLQLIMIHFVMVPFVMIIGVSGTLPIAAIYVALPVVVLLVLSGGAWPLTAIILAIMLLPGAAIGYMYRRGANAIAVMTAGVVAMIAVLLTILISLTLGGIDIQAEIKAMMQEQIHVFAQITGSTIVSEEALDTLISVAVRLLPLYIMIISVYYTVITHAISRRMLNKLGIAAASLPPVREWRLPKSLIWYYLIVLVLDFITPPDSALYTFILNIYPILLVTFTIQGLAFYFFWAFSKGRGRGLPITAIVLCLFFPPVMYITSMVGLIDTAFPLRQYISKR